MQRLLLILVLSAQVPYAYGAWPSQNGPTPEKEKSTVRCRIWTETQAFIRQAPAILHVSVENNTAQDVIIKGIEARLNDKESSRTGTPWEGSHSYLSRIDPETGLPLDVKLDSRGQLSFPDRKLTLKAGKSIEFVLDLARLKWTNELSSVLSPPGTFYGVVREGTYEISLSLSVYDSSGYLNVDSNKSSIQIQDKSEGP
jgi:hypothetical protein